MFICLPKSSIFTASAYWGFPGRHTLLKILLSAMAGVGVISSVAVFLFLLLASFSAAREERSLRNWAEVQAADQGKYNYLALLKIEGETPSVCSGSIPSKWTVLTYCADAKDDGKTKAYAGALKVSEATPTAQNIQVRNVKAVVEKNDVAGLKICILNEAWTDEVGIVGLPVQGESGQALTSCTLLGYGKDDDKAQVLIAQKLGEKECGATDATPGELDSLIAKDQIATKKLTVKDFGGPAVCGTEQRGINKLHKAAIVPTTDGCNVFVDVAYFSDWIKKEIQAADPEAPAGPDGPDGTGGTGGTGGNGTASSGYSIHSHLNKYSNWKVLWFLVPPIVAFLQY